VAGVGKGIRICSLAQHIRMRFDAGWNGLKPFNPHITSPGAGYLTRALKPFCALAETEFDLWK